MRLMEILTTYQPEGMAQDHLFHPHILCNLITPEDY
jgi:hypothetical protein